MDSILICVKSDITIPPLHTYDQVAIVQADLSDASACQNIFAEAQDTFGKIHVLINAAGITFRGTIYDTPIELWDQMMAVNLRAPFILTQACVNQMREHQIEGTIVNIISTSSQSCPSCFVQTGEHLV